MSSRDFLLSVRWLGLGTMLGSTDTSAANTRDLNLLPMVTLKYTEMWSTISSYKWGQKINIQIFISHTVYKLIPLHVR